MSCIQNTYRKYIVIIMSICFHISCVEKLFTQLVFNMEDLESEHALTLSFLKHELIWLKTETGFVLQATASTAVFLLNVLLCVSMCVCVCMCVWGGGSLSLLLPLSLSLICVCGSGILIVCVCVSVISLSLSLSLSLSHLSRISLSLSLCVLGVFEESL